MKHAILFKASNDDHSNEKDSYAENLEEIGVLSHVVPVIRFEFIDLDELATKLEHPDLYSGIIFSSPRCVEAVKMSISDTSLWKGHKAFVVGEKTAKDVYVQLGMTPEGQNSGTGKELSKYILQKVITKPLLLPVGNLSTDTIYSTLKENGLKIDRIVVYKTMPNPDIESLCRPLFEKHEISFLLYFSPSGVETTLPVFQNLNIDLKKIKIGAIGPTTEESLVKNSLKPDFVAQKPTPSHFADALKDLL